MLLRVTTCDQLDGANPIFDPVRAAYPEFAAWFAKCQAEQRRALMIELGEAPIAVAILKPEPPRMKLCTLVVAPQHRRKSYGSRLLMEACDEAAFLDMSLYCTVRADAPVTRAFMLTRGFSAIARRDDELEFA